MPTGVRQKQIAYDVYRGTNMRTRPYASATMPGARLPAHVSRKTGNCIPFSFFTRMLKETSVYRVTAVLVVKGPRPAMSPGSFRAAGSHLGCGVNPYAQHYPLGRAATESERNEDTDAINLTQASDPVRYAHY
jgi:hypothetical protein